MSYKEQRKGDELITKYRIILDVLRQNHPATTVAEKYSMHRNTIGNIINAFKTNIPTVLQKELLAASSNLSRCEIQEKLTPILNKTTKPYRNKRCATVSQEKLILTFFHKKNIGVGYSRMWKFIQRRKMKLGTETQNQIDENGILKNLTHPQLRGIYKRNDLNVRKTRTYNGNVKPLYDYNALACFERLHYDTKDIPDQKALPEDIYKKFKLRKDLPIIEWNIIDVKSRFRFIAYSHSRTSEFGLHFLLFVVQFIRAHTLFPGMKIIIGTDNGSEFFSGSEKKKKGWNDSLKLLNAEIYSYNPNFDVRKNLIERSHRTDDEEFFVPRGKFINNEISFLKEATGYSYYFNALRSHSGIAMNDKTPIEKLSASGIYNAYKFLNFPTMILENHINHIRSSTEVLRIAAFIQSQERSPGELHKDHKFCANINANFKNFPENAQNVLTYYLFLTFDF